MTHTLFFYGTLMAPPVLHRVIWNSPTPPTPAHASLLSIRPAILPSHQRHKVRDADYPAVLPCPSDPSASVRGTLVTGLTDGDVWRLDIFEGDDYTRRKVRVRVLEEGSQGEGGEEVETETYIWTASPDLLDPSEWDFSEFVRDKMKRWVGEDVGFADVEKAVEGLEKEGRKDPTGGRGVNGKITAQLEKENASEVLGSAV